MTLQDIHFGLELSLAAGWNQAEADWTMLLEQSALGSFIACMNGVNAGTVTTITYPERFSWVGMLLVVPEFRRLGIGTALLGAAIEALRDKGAICLDATPEGKKLYATLGFQEVYRLTRWLRKPAPLVIQPGSGCLPLRSGIFPAILQYDFPVFGADRSRILSALQGSAPPLAFYAERGGKVAGFCMGRFGSRYAHIGPVLADSLDVGRDLVLTALQSSAPRAVIIDTTFHQPGWNELLHHLGFEEQRPFIRMSLGEFTLPAQHHKQLAIAGPEIG